jgi:O-antigen ligase
MPPELGAGSHAVAVAEPRRSAPLREHADIASLLVAVAVLMGPVVQGGGGRDRHMLVVALVALMPAVVLGRVWRLGWLPVLLAVGPGAGALLVCATAPTGWAGVGDAARFLYAGLLWLAVRSIVDRPERRALVLVAISIGGLWQFEQAYLSWWGRGEVAHAMSGTFYAPNVFAAYMAGAGLCAAVLATTDQRRLRIVGFIAAPFCLSAVAYSSSRATIALSLLACAVTVVLFVLRRSWRELGRLVGVLAATVALASLLGSSLLMSQGGGALAGASQKSSAATETLASSGGVRMEWWRAAVQVGNEHPLTGAGFGSFSGAESRFQPADSERSVYAHNVLLQGWADGGIALALPLCLALLAIALGLLHRLRVRETAALAGLIGSAVMVSHALLDFDAQYPACLGLAVLLAALAAAVPSGGAPDTSSHVARPWRAAAVVLVLLLGLAAAVRADAADARYRRGEVSGGAWTGADGPLRDARFDVLRLRKGQHQADLLRRTARLQQDNVALTWDRARALVAAGRPAEARNLAQAAWRTRAERQPGQVIGYSGVLAALGERDAAVSALVSAFRTSSTRATSGDEPVRLLVAITALDRADVSRCLTPELPGRLRGTVADAPTSCSATLLPFGTGGAS